MNRPETLQEWAHSERPILTLLFTDIVSSTRIGQHEGDERWVQSLATHFATGRELARKYGGFVVKVIGDAFMVAFRNSTNAVDFAVEFSMDTGVDFIGIRVGINSGQVTIMDNDVYGLDVNKAARVQSMPKEEGIYITDPVRSDYENAKGKMRDLKFGPVLARPGNFPRTRVTSVFSRELSLAYKRIRRARQALLGEGMSVATPPVKSEAASLQPRISPIPPPLIKPR